MHDASKRKWTFLDRANHRARAKEMKSRVPYGSIAGVLVIAEVALLGLRWFSISTHASFLGLRVTEMLVSLLAQGMIPIIMGYAMVERYGGILKALGAMLSHLPSYLATLIFSAVAMLGGYLLLYLPGLYISTRLTFAPAVCLVERTGPYEAMKRSWALSEGYFWVLFHAALLYAVARWSAVGLVLFPGLDSAGGELWTSLVNVVAQTLYMSFVTFKYFESRLGEGFGFVDLEGQLSFVYGEEGSPGSA